mgnify:CR=1 FL=1
MELPWFKLYASNELAETIYLKNGEAGLYFKLMCKYWCDNHCGFDQETIDRLCVTNEDIHNMDYVLEKFFILIELDKEWSEQPEKLSELYNNYYNALEDKNFASYPSSWLSNLSFLDESKVVNINSPDEIKKTEEILEKSRYTRCVQAGKLIGITQSKFDELKIKYG